MAGQTPTPRRPPLTKGESKAATPRKSPSKVPTPRAQSAPKERPSAPAAALKETIGKVKGGLAFSRMLEGSKAPQTRGDPNNIKVGVRCRPLSNTEKGLNESEIVQFSGNSICVTNPMPAAGEEPDHIFAYDHLYAQDSESESVFTDMAQPLVEGLFEGFNGTIFAYGQTGSGKTHSMMGNAKDPGVIPRCAIDIFERANALLASLGDGASVIVRASYIQIYREVLQDLLGNSNEDLKIRRDPKSGTYVQGLSERQLHDADGLTAVIEQGNKRRAVASTLMNSESSRSHAVVIIRLEQEHPADPLHGKGKRKILSKVNLVDLAGSERASKTGATGETLKEAIAINQSLSALGNVINALSDPKAKGHIPYRSSKLTHLLEESLGGNSHTVMLAAISPAGRNYAETFQTLQYASRAKLIVTNAKANTFQEEMKGSPFGAAHMEQMQAQMAADVAAAQQAAAAQVEQQLQALKAQASDELVKTQGELAEARAQLAALQAVSDLQASSLEQEKQRAGEAERNKSAAVEAAEMALGHVKAELAAAQQRAEELLQQKQIQHDKELEAGRIMLQAKSREFETVAAEKDRLAADSLEGLLQKAQAQEEVRAKDGELQGLQVKYAAVDERVSSLQRELDAARSQLRSVEAQRDQAWAREKLLEEQRQTAVEESKKSTEKESALQQQLQDALAAQVKLQQEANARASEASRNEMAGGLAEVQKALARLEARTEQQSAAKAAVEGAVTRGHEEELARLDSLLQAQASAHSAAIDQLERRAQSEASRLAEAAQRATEQSESQITTLQSRLKESTERQVRLQSENATRKAAADALGERVAMLQEQLASLQLDTEQQRHAGIAERAELEEAGRAKQEELEAMRLKVLQHQHEAEGMRQQIRERDESLARRAERLRQLQTLYERALQDKQRVEEASWAERQELHDERRSLELRLREEGGRARQAEELAERLKHESGGLLSRLFTSKQGEALPGQAPMASPARLTAKEAWAESGSQPQSGRRTPMAKPLAVA